jgi:hypothetical protein
MLLYRPYTLVKVIKFSWKHGIKQVFIIACTVLFTFEHIRPYLFFPDLMALLDGDFALTKLIFDAQAKILSQLYFDLAYAIPNEEVGCRKRHCPRMCKYLRQSQHLTEFYPTPTTRPLFDLNNDYAFMLATEHGLCPYCISIWRHNLRALRQRSWDALPRHFGFLGPGWSALRHHEGVPLSAQTILDEQEREEREW